MKPTPLALATLTMASVAAGLFAQLPPAGVREPLRSESVGPLTSPPPVTVTPPGAYSLSIDGDFELGGFVFKDGYPFLHTEGGYAYRNTAFGLNALISSTPGTPLSYSGTANTAVGVGALRSNTSGFHNTAGGAQSLASNDIGLANTAFGASALMFNTSGSSNTAVGELALFYNRYSGNTAVGARSLMLNHEGASNTAVGYAALVYNVSGDGNVAAGYRALRHNDGGSDNVAVGNGALWQNTSGSDNVAIGHLSGQYATGDNNIFLRNYGVAGESGRIWIGTEGTHVATHVAGVVGAAVDPATAVAVRVDATGKLGTTPSSRRYKNEIRDMAQASQALLDLRPVTFRYKEEVVPGEHLRQYGLIAEEVALVLPELVVFKEGQPETVKYDLLVPMLLNELQEQHRQNQAQWILIGSLLVTGAALTVGRWWFMST